MAHGTQLWIMVDIEARKRNGGLFVLFGPGDLSVTPHQGGILHLEQAGRPKRSWRFREEVLIEFTASR